MATQNQNPFSRIVDGSGRGRSTDVAIAQALAGIETQLKRLADVEEEKMANERIAMQREEDRHKFDAGGDLKDEYANQPRPRLSHLKLSSQRSGVDVECWCVSPTNHY